MRNHRARWSAIGAAVAVSIGAGGLITFASASGGSASTFTPITPCRLLDTRADGPATGATPPRTTPLGQQEAITIPARGNFGNCVGLSATDTGAVLNVTIANPTAGGFLTVWPADKKQPLASSLDWVPFQGATPNQVTTGLDASGQFSIYNNTGKVDVIVDVVGLYELAGAGGGGGVGPQGPPGSNGTPGPAGLPGAGVNVMTAAAPDAAESSGQYNSLVLDSHGNPVISHYIEADSAQNPVGDLAVTHCDDPTCAPGGDVTNTVDTVGDVGQYTSLVLDSNGFPVISYYDVTNSSLKVAHCNDANCAPGGDSIVTLDNTATDTGKFTSLALDASGFPVISYYDATNSSRNLKLAHCNDANCDVGGDSIITADASPNDVGTYTSIALAGGGNPTISYFDATAQAVKLLHCTDANCTSGSPNTVATTPGISVQHDSLTLDGNGFPVVSYLDEFHFVEVTHCDDLACAVGGDATNELSDPNPVAGPAYTSIALDGNGFPVVSYAEANVLRVGRCLDVNCATSVVSIADNLGDSTGAFSSIVLDVAGNPIVASYDDANFDLVVTHCVDPFCNPRRIRSING